MIAIYVLVPIIVIIGIAGFVFKKYYLNNNNFNLNDDVGDIATYSNNRRRPSYESGGNGMQMAERGHRRTNSRHDNDNRYRDQSRYVRDSPREVDIENDNEQPTFNRSRQEHIPKPSKI